MKNEIDVLRIFLNWHEIWRKLMCHRSTSNPGVLKLGFTDPQGVRGQGSGGPFMSNKNVSTFIFR